MYFVGPQCANSSLSSNVHFTNNNNISNMFVPSTISFISTPSILDLEDVLETVKLFMRTNC